MAHAPLAKGPLTRSAAGLEAKKSLFDKGKHDSVMKIKTHSKAEIRAMKRPQLRDLAKTIGVTTSGSDADVADRLIAKFEDMRKTDPDFMIVESFVSILLSRDFLHAPITMPLALRSRSSCMISSTI